MNCERDGRTLLITNIPDLHEPDDTIIIAPKCLVVTITYVGHTSAISDIALDHTVIPAIVKTLNTETENPPQ